MMMYLFRTGDYFTKTLRKMMTVVLAGVILVVNMGFPSDLLDRFFMRDSTGQKDIRKLLQKYSLHRFDRFLSLYVRAHWILFLLK